MPEWSDVKNKPFTFLATIGGATQAVVGDDPRLVDDRTPTGATVSTAEIAGTAVTKAKLATQCRLPVTEPTWTSPTSASSGPARTQRADRHWRQTRSACDSSWGLVIESVAVRGITADASGNLVVELRNNGIRD